LLTLGLYPVVVALPTRTGYKIPPSIWPKVIEQRECKSLRRLAGEYGVSHEAVRRTLKVAKESI